MLIERFKRRLLTNQQPQRGGAEASPWSSSRERVLSLSLRLRALAAGSSASSHSFKHTLIQLKAKSNLAVGVSWSVHESPSLRCDKAVQGTTPLSHADPPGLICSTPAAVSAGEAAMKSEMELITTLESHTQERSNANVSAGRHRSRHNFGGNCSFKKIHWFFLTGVFQRVTFAKHT